MKLFSKLMWLFKTRKKKTKLWQFHINFTFGFDYADYFSVLFNRMKKLSAMLGISAPNLVE